MIYRKLFCLLFILVISSLSSGCAGMFVRTSEPLSPEAKIGMVRIIRYNPMVLDDQTIDKTGSPYLGARFFTDRGTPAYITEHLFLGLREKLKSKVTLINVEAPNEYTVDKILLSNTENVDYIISCEIINYVSSGEFGTLIGIDFTVINTKNKIIIGKGRLQSFASKYSDSVSAIKDIADKLVGKLY